MAWVFVAGCVGGVDKEESEYANVDDFVDAYFDRFCAELEACGETTCDDLSIGTTTGTETDCDYDADAAEDCVEGEWICSGTGDFGFPVPPDICSKVCGEFSTTTSTDRSTN